MGSSPRVRGTVLGQQPRKALVGIIPARAGNRLRVGGKLALGWDHPRACGEQYRERNQIIMRAGSSPRVRGTAIIINIRCSGPGIIPARAGNRGSACRSARPSRDHPRACGEQVPDIAVWGVCSGSSPRVRGTASRLTLSRSTCRIIPARAGNRPPRTSRRSWGTHHPRACGEQAMHLHMPRWHIGSSPRVRGTAYWGYNVANSSGIIPARAGNRLIHWQLSMGW